MADEDDVAGKRHGQSDNVSELRQQTQAEPQVNGHPRLASSEQGPVYPSSVYETGQQSPSHGSNANALEYQGSNSVSSEALNPTTEPNARHTRSADNGVAKPKSASKFAELGLSRNVISVNFCVPYQVQYTSKGNWQLPPRRGTSALFDSFTYLSSAESEWTHTLVAWTGEIESVEIDQRPTRNGTSTTSLPINKDSAPIPVDSHSPSPQSPNASGLRISSVQQRLLAQKLSCQHSGRVHPVWLPDSVDSDGDTFRDHDKWRRYGEQSLFRLFHYKQSDPSDGCATRTAWKDYERMNQAFAAAVMNVYRPGDIVMIHDYHLLLLPRMLRQLLPNANLGLFLHIPFPSSEYFRTLPTRKQLLHGMLGADMIAFQTHSYAAHFTFCCEQVLGLTASEEGVDYLGAHTAFEAFPIGINAATTQQAAFECSVNETIEQLFQQKVHEGKKIIVGRDRLDSARGVAQKLQAFEMFLERYPEWIERVVLVQVTSPTGVKEQGEKREKIENIITRINSNLGHLGYTPVRYFPQYLSKDEYLALLRIADLGLITSVRDGMSTTALEYVICQRDKRSPLIISEFSGTASILQHAATINPWDLSGVASKIHEALTMSEEDKAAVHDELYRAVTENSVQRWTTKCINRLVANLVANNRYQRTPPLDRGELLKQYTLSHRRLFLFDYDGTLTPIVRDPAAAVPTGHLTHALETLASDPRNAVWIISGRDQVFLEAHLGHIAALGLSAEHGCFMRKPYDSSSSSTAATAATASTATWDNLTENVDMAWQPKVAAVFARYTQTTPGSYVERKKIALTWHYRKAEDAALARHEAQRCRRELHQTVARRFEVDVMAGKANVEVRPHFVNKGEIVRRLLRAYGEGSECAPDFVLCLGDDSTDEDMFQKLRCSNLPAGQVFAVTVGASNKPTLASSYLPEPEDVVSVIGLLNAHASGEAAAGAVEAAAQSHLGSADAS